MASQHHHCSTTHPSHCPSLSYSPPVPPCPLFPHCPPHPPNFSRMALRPCARDPTRGRPPTPSGLSLCPAEPGAALSRAPPAGAALQAHTGGTAMSRGLWGAIPAVGCCGATCGDTPLAAPCVLGGASCKERGGVRGVEEGTHTPPPGTPGAQGPFPWGGWTLWGSSDPRTLGCHRPNGSYLWGMLETQGTWGT